MGSLFLFTPVTGSLSKFAKMTAAEFIQSGLIETYCLGFTSAEENTVVEQMAAAHPEVKQEIERVRNSFGEFIKKRKMQPSASVKTAIMNTIYSQQVAIKNEWVPLMNETVDFSRFYKAAQANMLQAPTEDFENLFVKELPSTIEILNFAVWAKKGHEEEMHDDRNEYIAILDGGCDMYMEGKIISYSKGQVIAIPTGIPHHAVITSQQPMFALVQRQLI
ncbi:MAG: cupin domain-containing protein [Sphingobacteriales bacterium]|nr:MAG: cupin domain-containing protein [Sphingobacteriales bacterium]